MCLGGKQLSGTLIARDPLVATQLKRCLPVWCKMVESSPRVSSRTRARVNTVYNQVKITHQRTRVLCSFIAIALQDKDSGSLGIVGKPNMHEIAVPRQCMQQPLDPLCWLGASAGLLSTTSGLCLEIYFLIWMHFSARLDLPVLLVLEDILVRFCTHLSLSMGLRMTASPNAGRGSSTRFAPGFVFEIDPSTSPSSVAPPGFKLDTLPAQTSV